MSSGKQQRTGVLAWNTNRAGDKVNGMKGREGKSGLVLVKQGANSLFECDKMNK